MRRAIRVIRGQAARGENLADARDQGRCPQQNEQGTQARAWPEDQHCPDAEDNQCLGEVLTELRVAECATQPGNAVNKAVDAYRKDEDAATQARPEEGKDAESDGKDAAQQERSPDAAELVAHVRPYTDGYGAEARSVDFVLFMSLISSQGFLKPCCRKGHIKKPEVRSKTQNIATVPTR
jgi:hypothetical protein